MSRHMLLLLPLLLPLAACRSPEKGSPGSSHDSVGTDTAVDCSTEICNGVDDDCDGEVDEGLLTTFYADVDGDGHGNPAAPVRACLPEEGLAYYADDCDDAEPAAWIGAEETCDGIDNDCDGSVDEDLGSTWYSDADGDGWGLEGVSTVACEPPSFYADRSGDCNDLSAAIHPGATELCNAVDDDCDGVIDSGEACPCAVEYHPDARHPYLFCTDAMDWASASASCAAVDYRLVTFDSAEELAWASSAVASYPSNYWWLGFTDVASEGSWAWDDGTIPDYTNWCSGEPNNSHGRECYDDSEEDCAMINWGVDACWNDYPCGCDLPYFICEGDSEGRTD